MYNRQEIKFTPEEILEYLRKSQSDDPLLTVEEVLAKHETILGQWAEKHLDGQVPEENKYREVVSGETIKDRPEMTALLRRIESPKIKAVLVVEPQRLTRGDLEDIGRLMKLLKHTNTVVITPERTYDLRDPYDWDAIERELKRGNDYLEYYKKIQARGKLLSVSQGNFLGSKAPYGFDRTKVMDGKRVCPTLKENKEKADVVRLIFDLYANHNMGRAKIARHLNELHIKSPSGKHWSPDSLLGILRNEHYIGKVRWNWRTTKTVVEDGEFIKIRPHSRVDEYLIFEGRHDGIISQELWDAVRAKMGLQPRTRPKTKMRNPLAGLLYCGCGRSMTLFCRYNEDGALAEPPRLQCPEQSRCRTRSCTLYEMMDRVVEVLEDSIEDFEMRVRNNAGDSVKLHAALVKQLEAREAELAKKEISQWEKYTEEGMPKHIFDQLNEKVLQEKEEVRQALCDARKSMPEPVDYEDKITTFAEALEALKDPEADAAKKNMLLKACIDRIDYHRERGVRLPVKANKFEPCWSETPIEMDVALKV